MMAAGFFSHYLSSPYFQNTFPFVSSFRETDVIRKHFLEQGIVPSTHFIYGYIASDIW